MNARLLTGLRIGASILGWLFVIGISISLFGQFDLYLYSQRVTTGFPGIAARFDFISALNSFLSNIGSAFFAFLIAAVIPMIENHAPVGIEMATRVMAVCCLSYLADALVRLWSLILNLSVVLSASKDFGWRFWLPYASMVIPVLVPILYATAIYIFYSHFVRMVTFESEVA
jgi:hypothetical protein